MSASKNSPNVTAPIDRTILDAREDAPRFRSLVRAWLERTVPPNWREQQAAASEAQQFAFQRWWFGELSKIGMATAHWAADWGGEALGVASQIIFFEELARAHAPSNSMFVSTLYQLPATLFAAGTPQQRERYITGAQAGVLWCQGFSEPGAGSDLASLRTSAVREGDVYVVNGQKVWTSYGHFAKHCLLLARTDPSQPKHRGISMFVMDMDSPGIELRPIRQMTGQAEFNEMFLQEVRIPGANRIGEENAGWAVAQSTLSAERGLIIFEQSQRLRYFLAELLNSATARTSWLRDDESRRAFVRLYADAVALTLMTREMLEQNDTHGEMAAQELPVYIKLHYAVLLQKLGALLVRVNGLAGQLLRPDIATSGVPGGNWMFDYLSSWNWTIAGGTNEIMRNIIAERILGLPR
jgi:alkylation response protein AidB-like acyl-CoA dehydrogenase